MYEEQISPLIGFIFYPPYIFQKVACMKGIEDYPVGLNTLKLFTHFSTFKQPKGWIRMAAQSCTFSTDANAEKNRIFRDRTHPFDTNIR